MNSRCFLALWIDCSYIIFTAILFIRCSYKRTLLASPSHQCLVLLVLRSVIESYIWAITLMLSYCLLLVGCMRHGPASLLKEVEDAMRWWLLDTIMRSISDLSTALWHNKIRNQDFYFISAYPWEPEERTGGGSLQWSRSCAEHGTCSIGVVV